MRRSGNPRAAALAQPDLAERQVDLVEDDEERVGREAVTVEELLNRAPAVVHERLRPCDRDTDVAERAFRDARLSGLRVEVETRTLGQPAGDLEANVVPRVCIAVTRVTEADDQPIDTWRRGALKQLREADQCLLLLCGRRKGAPPQTPVGPRATRVSEG
jgi:hypothetical protein